MSERIAAVSIDVWGNYHCGMRSNLSVGSVYVWPFTELDKSGEYKQRDLI